MGEALIGIAITKFLLSHKRQVVRLVAKLFTVFFVMLS
jgi:hypothetical protein